jgi:prepilin-type N-terminal cleavage/methylation domain-containing protein
MTPRPAFTLIETMVAVTLLALLAAATALTFARPLHRARTLEAVEQIRYLDASTRDLARRSGRPARIVFDLDDNAVSREEGSARQATYRTALASPIKIGAFRTPGQHDDSGSHTIPVSALALSPSYALKLSTPDGARWLLVSGLSGESTILTDDAQVESILARASARRDAD